MKNLVITSITVLIICLSLSCEKDDIVDVPFEYIFLDDLYEHNISKITISQGLAGTLTMKEGNCMPSPGGENYCNTFPIERTIKVFEYTTKDDVEGYGSLYDEVNSRFVAKTETDVDGFFQIELPIGKYSIFIIEKGKYYASGSDGQGGIHPIEISKDSVSTHLLRIDYAVY